MGNIPDFNDADHAKDRAGATTGKTGADLN